MLTSWRIKIFKKNLHHHHNTEFFLNSVVLASASKLCAMLSADTFSWIVRFLYSSPASKKNLETMFRRSIFCLCKWWWPTSFWSGEGVKKVPNIPFDDYPLRVALICVDESLHRCNFSWTSRSLPWRPTAAAWTSSQRTQPWWLPWPASTRYENGAQGITRSMKSHSGAALRARLERSSMIIGPLTLSRPEMALNNISSGPPQ